MHLKCMNFQHRCCTFLRLLFILEIEVYCYPWVQLWSLPTDCRVWVKVIAGGCLQPECGEVLKLSGQWLRWEQEIFTSSADTRRSDLLLWWDPIIRDSTKLSLTVIKTTVTISSRESYASKTCSLPMDLFPAELFSTSECLFVLCDVFWLAA